MTNEEPIQIFALQEFRLLVPDADGAVARIVASTYAGGEPRIPMLTSIDDRRDVATVRALRAEVNGDAEMNVALAPYVSEWQGERRYKSRIAESSLSPPGFFRLAVTESGINDERSRTEDERTAPAGGASFASWLLWIGAPVATHAGLLVLIGERAEERGPNALTWPLPLSRALGVRIYDNRAEASPLV